MKAVAVLSLRLFSLLYHQRRGEKVEEKNNKGLHTISLEDRISSQMQNADLIGITGQQAQVQVCVSTRFHGNGVFWWFI